jgi:predicted ATP-grasp superfamily ATP-dependent carboligase
MNGKLDRGGSREYPTAIIVGFEPNGLGVARALHKSGIQCIGIGAQGWHAPYATRTTRIVRCKTWSEDEVINRLLDIGSKLNQPAPVLITKDDAVLWLSKNRAKLAEHFEINLPPPETVELLMSKTRFLDLAQKEGWPLPVTIKIDSLEELIACRYEVPYPCILKPAIKNSQFRRNSPSKAFRLSTEAELLECYRMVSRWERSVVIQEWIEGGDERIAYCLAYYSRTSEPLAMFAGRKLRQFPVEHGNTVIAAPAPNEWRDRIMELSRTIFEKVGYQGLGSIEYKMRENGSPVLIEPTVGRTDWQSEVAVINGVNIPTVACLDTAGISSQSFIEHVAPRKLIDGRAHRRFFFESVRQGKFPIWQWFSERRGKKNFMILRVSDPGPFLAATVGRILRSILRPMVRRMRSLVRRQP